LSEYLATPLANQPVLVIETPENGDDSQGGCRMTVVRLLDANQHPESQNLVPSMLDPAGGDGANGVAVCSSFSNRCAEGCA
jgi:hypothetical protein